VGGADPALVAKLLPEVSGIDERAAALLQADAELLDIVRVTIAEMRRSFAEADLHVDYTLDEQDGQPLVFVSAHTAQEDAAALDGLRKVRERMSAAF
jgi:hypothetical protein